MKVLKLVLNFFLHILCIGILIYFFWPIAIWYFNHQPILGVDFYNTFTFAKYFSQDLSFFPLKFLYFWYSGSPVSDNIIFLWYQIIGWVSYFISILSAIKYSMLAAFSLLLMFVYLLSYRLSKNHFISLLIAVLVSYSANMYGSLIWGGSLPYFANQLFFPASLWSATYYVQTGNRRFYWITVLFVGLSILGHLLNTGAFVFTGVIVVLLFSDRLKSISWKSKISEVFVLLLIAYLFAFRLAANIYAGFIWQILQVVFSKISTSSNVLSQQPVQKEVILETELAMIALDKSRTLYLYSDTAKDLFTLLIFGLVLFVIIFFVISRKKQSFAYVLPWFLLCIYSTLHVFLNANGISVLFQAWYREFWHFPITLGLLIASLVGCSQISLSSVSKIIGRFFYIFIFTLSVGFLSYIFIYQNYKNTISLLEIRSQTSSAFPEGLNLVNSQKELDSLKKQLIPNWLNPQERNYRLFTTDAQVNVWWNALYDMPLVKGYLDPVIGSGYAGDHYLLDQAISGDSLVKDLKYQPEIAKNMALYYLDWYAIKYIEGGHLSQSANKNISSYLNDVVSENTKVNIKGAYVLTDPVKLKREIMPDVIQQLNYYQIKDSYVSPIATLTYSPTVLCLCDWADYQSLTKILSMHNFNSKYVITINSEKNIDSFSKNELEQFSVIILSNYKYKNKTKAFQLIAQYVEQGGNLFIDTGGNVLETKGNSLPEFFPFTNSQRTGLGKSWDLKQTSDQIFDNINFSIFSLPIYENDQWSFSYPIGEIKNGAKILLTQKQKPIIINQNLGKGVMYWSGMNLMYHINQNNNLEESNLFINILQKMISLESQKYEIGHPEFISDRKINFKETNVNAKGLLFKQEFFEGWKININGKSVKAYPAGPTYPGFIYIPIKEKGEININIFYQGNVRSWFLWVLSLIILLFLLDQIIFSGIILGNKTKRIFHSLKIRSNFWWEKEE